MDGNTGLVLEGGGMRGTFTAGVLDCFLDNGITFPYTIGVSAGASNGLSYASKQRGRARACNIDALVKYRYVGYRHLIKSGNLMDYDFMFSELPRKIYPYDFETYKNSGRFVIGATNCLTGEIEYFEKQPDMDSLLNVCKASCSLPYICPTVDVGGVPMLDGGIVDSIPLSRARSDGFTKNVVVLTRNKGYRKSEKKLRLPWFVYKKYPKLREALIARNANYNKILDKIEKIEGKEDIIVIRPQKKMEVGRMEMDPAKLGRLYGEGYECASKVVGQIRAL